MFYPFGTTRVLVFNLIRCIVERNNFASFIEAFKDKIAVLFTERNDENRMGITRGLPLNTIMIVS